MAIRLQGGSVLLVSGQPTTAEDCCCANCEDYQYSLELVISGLEECACALKSAFGGHIAFDNFGSQITGGLLNYSGVTPNLWGGSLGTADYHIYGDQDGECDYEDVFDTGSAGVDCIMTCEGGIFVISASVLSHPVFYGTITIGGSTTAANQYTDAGVCSAPDPSPWFYGGSATLGL